MKKQFFVMIKVLFITICLSGCTDQFKDETTENEFEMTAQDFVDDMYSSIDVDGDTQIMILDYQSLKEGDTLILTDTISEIYYQTLFQVGTSILFDVENFTFAGVSSNKTGFLFRGDLTNTYSVGDKVQITLTVIHVVINNESTGVILDWEVFEEGWNESYFSIYMTQILPEESIILIPNESQLTINAPSLVSENEKFEVKITANGIGIEGASVNFTESSDLDTGAILEFTDAQGKVEFIAPGVDEDMQYTIYVQHEGYLPVSTQIIVQNPLQK